MVLVQPFTLPTAAAQGLLSNIYSFLRTGTLYFWSPVSSPSAHETGLAKQQSSKAKARAPSTPTALAALALPGVLLHLGEAPRCVVGALCSSCEVVSLVFYWDPELGEH